MATLNVFETVHELFAQVAAQHAGNPIVVSLLQNLQHQVICAITIGQQLPSAHFVQLFESMPLHHDPK